jgi:hypothetical protein
MTEKADKPAGLAVWAERLRGRSRMAVATIGGMALAGFFFASQPLSERIDAANLRYSRAETRMHLGSDVADLRRLAGLYAKKLQRGVDLNDWTQYLLNGINAQRVRLSKLDPTDAQSLGPCKVLTWDCVIEGDFESLARVVEWLENGDRLIRLDRILFEGKHGRLVLTMNIRGLALDVPPEKLRQDQEKRDIEKAKAEKRAAQMAEQNKSEKSKSWIDEKPLAIPDNVQLPGNVKIPDEVLKAAKEGQPAQ